MSTSTMAPQTLTAKDFATDQEVRWCPGCGDYSILAQVQKVMPTLGILRENIVTNPLQCVYWLVLNMCKVEVKDLNFLCQEKLIFYQ